MKNAVFKGQQISNQIPGDVQIVGIRWLGVEAKDISFELSVARWRGTLTCFYATDLRIALDQSGYIGVIPSWHCDIQPMKEGWGVTFDLSPAGLVALHCNDVQLDVANP